MNPQHSTTKPIVTHLIAGVGGGLIVAACSAVMHRTLTGTIGLVSPRLADKLGKAVERHQLKKLERQVAAQDFQGVGDQPFWATSGARWRQIVLDNTPQGASHNPGAPWAPAPTTWGPEVAPGHPFAGPAEEWTLGNLSST